VNPPRSRKRIGRWNDIATRQIVYQSDDALEIDEIDHFEIVRKRVYFDDVLLATMHTRVGMAFVITMAVFFLLLAGIAAAFQSAHETDIATGFAVFSAPFLVALFIRLVLKQEVITIYGRRSRAAMKFTFRQTYAHEKFNEICSLVTRAQDRIAAEQPALDRPPEILSAIPMPPAPETERMASSEGPAGEVALPAAPEAEPADDPALRQQ
jgi:hypothetical protein